MNTPVKYRIGNLEIPFYELARGAFSGDDVTMDYNPSKRKDMPAEIKKLRRRRLEEERENARMNKKDYPNGLLVSVYGYRADRGGDKLMLDAGPGTYFRHFGTNLSLDEALENGKTIREKYISEPGNLDDILENPLGVGAVTVTSDNKMLVVVRSTNSDSGAGKIGVSPSGYMRRDKDFSGGVPDPRLTLSREALEEICVREPEIEKVVFTGFGRSEKTMHTDLYGIMFTSLTGQQILDRVGEERKRKPKTSYKTAGDSGVSENEEIILIDFEPEAVARSGILSDPSRVLSSHAVAIAEALVYRYGRETVESCFR